MNRSSTGRTSRSMKSSNERCTSLISAGMLKSIQSRLGEPRQHPCPAPVHGNAKRGSIHVVSDPTERPSFSFPTEAPSQPAAPRDAATVIVVRDGSAGLETFMLQRHLNSDFIGGAYVFPGGSVDEGDRDPRFAELVTGVSDDHRRCMQDSTLPLLICAIRETFEEAGVLLARHADDGRTVALVDDEAWQARRNDLNSRKRSFLDIVQETGIILDASLVRYWSRIVTPLAAPKRFDARFLLARMPRGQDPLHDDVETTASTWIQPSKAVEDGRAGRFQIIFPTRRTLEQIDDYSSADELFAAAEGRDPDPLTPEIVLSDGVAKIKLDGDTIHDL